MTSAPMVLSRRTFLLASTAAGATLAVGVTTATLTPASAAPSPSPSPPSTPLAALPALYGTPTDLARTHTEQTWTRDADGAVVAFDPTTDTWQPSSHPWTDVLSFGPAFHARWGRRSATNQTVLVFGAAPTTPTNPTTPSPESTQSDPTATATTRETTSSAPPVTTSQQPVEHGPSRAASDSKLSYTGFPVGAVAAVSLAAVGVGAAVSFLARRKITTPATTALASPSDDTPEPST